MTRGRRLLAAATLVALGAAAAWGAFSYRQRVLDRTRVLAETRLLRANVAQQAGDYNNARNGYLQVLAADPRNSQARAHLFDLTFQAGARQEAEHHLARLQDLLGPEASEVKRRRAMLESSTARR